MYAGVKIPGNSRSSQSTYQAPSRQTSTYQATASIPAGFVAPSIVSGGCQTSGAAEYSSETNTIHTCFGFEGLPHAFQRYAIAHEARHSEDWQADGKFDKDLESILRTVF